MTTLSTALKLIILVVSVVMFFRTKAGDKVGKFFPAPFWIYFFSILCSTLGIFPTQSPVYPFIERYFLPAALILMLIGAPLRALFKIGAKALAAMALATGSMMAAAIIGYVFFFKWLPAEGWKATGALLGTWIGGSANMLAIKEILGLSPEGFAPLIVVDTLLSYLWLAMLLAGVGYQLWFDKPFACQQADVAAERSFIPAENNFEPRARGGWKRGAVLAGVGVLVKFMVVAGTAINAELKFLSAAGWTVLLSSTAALSLATTRARVVEKWGASKWGTWFLYLVLVTIGAKTNLFSVQGVPWYLFFGGVILLLHGVLLLILGRLLKIPLYLLMIASQANVGGVVSAPIVAGIYRPGAAHVGVLMAILGTVLGTYLGVLGGWICRFIQ